MSQQASNLISEKYSIVLSPQKEEKNNIEQENEDVLQTLEIAPQEFQRAKSEDRTSQIPMAKIKRKLTSYEQAKQVETPIQSNQSNPHENIKITLFRHSLPVHTRNLNYSVLSGRESCIGSERGLSLVEEPQQFLQKIEFSQFQRWFLLIITVILNSVVPCWMTVDINSEGMTRNAWRFFTMSVTMIPFVMTEQRWVRSQEQKLSTLLKFKNLRRIYFCSFNHCVWVLFGVMATKLTAGSHSFCFLRLKFFVISLLKFYRKEQCHEGEIGGSLLVTIGLLMMFWDSLFLPVIQHPTIPYLQNQGWQRLLGDFSALVGCLFLFKLQSKYELPKGPRFTLVFLYNLSISLNLILFAFFMGLNEFSFDPHKGVFGLFTSKNFVSIFYVSIILGLNLILANVLVNQLFSLFIRNMTSSFEIVITTTLFHIFSLEESYSGLTNLGLCFIVPGMMMIIGGQGSLQKLEMKINEEIYTCDNIANGNQKQIMEVVLKHVLAAANNSPKKSSMKNLKTINEEQMGQEKQSTQNKQKQD